MSYSEFKEAKELIDKEIITWREKNLDLITKDKPYALQDLSTNTKFKFKIKNIFYNPDREEVSFRTNTHKSYNDSKYFYDVKNDNYIEIDSQKCFLFLKEPMILFKHVFGKYTVQLSDEYERDSFTKLENFNTILYSSDKSTYPNDLKIKRIDFDNNMKLTSLLPIFITSHSKRYSDEMNEFGNKKINQSFNNIEELYNTIMESNDILMLYDINLKMQEMYERLEQRIKYTEKAIKTLNQYPEINKKIISTSYKIKEVTEIKKDENKNMEYHKMKVIYKNLLEENKLEVKQENKKMKI